MTAEKQSIAIIGGGVAGIVAAWRLSKRYQVSIFETASYLGGHTNTYIIPSGQDCGLPIDTGFIVLNDKTYPLFTKFLNELDVAIRYADMSFSVYSLRSRLQYCSRDINVLFAQRSNIFSLRFLTMLLEIKRFWKIASEALEADNLKDQTVAQFLSKNEFKAVLKEDFLYPLAAAVWSSSSQQLDHFPAITFLSFFRNHGWLSYFDQPRWQTVQGGSNQYVKKFQGLFEGNVFLNSPVQSVGLRSEINRHEIIFENGNRALFDKLVIATHADQVLPLLQDASLEEQRVFGSWLYSDNLALLHTDSCFMPPLRRAWGAWNYREELADKSSQPVSVSYYMNLLQGFEAKSSYFVTLNPRFEPKRGSVVEQFYYKHPIFNSTSVASQKDLQNWNGTLDRWYCGSYCGYGFHEDAVRSAEWVAKKILAS